MDGWCLDEYWRCLDSIGFGQRWGGDARLLLGLKMHSDGIAPSELQRLAKCAAERSATPQRLLSHWLGSPYRWKNVLLDLAADEKHRRLHVRTDDEDWLRVKLPRAIGKILKGVGL